MIDHRLHIRNQITFIKVELENRLVKFISDNPLHYYTLESYPLLIAKIHLCGRLFEYFDDNNYPERVPNDLITKLQSKNENGIIAQECNSMMTMIFTSYDNPLSNALNNNIYE